MDGYIHNIEYFRYDGRYFGIIPSMDKIFSIKEGIAADGSQIKLPAGIISREKPLFHSSYTRKDRIKRVFVLTGACNLKCSYCFEGEHKNTMVLRPEEVEKGIINMFDEAQKSGKRIISFSLFGGEPTMNWPAVEKAIDTAQRLEKCTDIVCYKAIVTNGVMKAEQAKYLAAHFNFVYFSLDGPKELFLRQRRPKAGDEVYDIIFDNASEVYRSGTYLSFKVTVTRLTIDHLKEIDDFFSLNFPACGRLYQPCMVDKEDPLYISFGEFLEKYYELKKYSLFEKNMTTPLYKNKPSDRFCNLSVRNVIYPDGNVLACHRSNMCIPDDKVKEAFKAGTYENGVLYRDPEKQAYLKKFTVENISGCNDCVFRYHCCGGCPTVKLLSGNGDMFRKADYCEDFLKYAYANALSRLYGEDLPFIRELPDRVEFPYIGSSSENIREPENIMGEDIFKDYIAERIITVEE